MSNTAQSRPANETRPGDLTRSDAIKLLQEEKQKRIETEKESQKLLNRINELNALLAHAERQIADEKQRHLVTQQDLGRTQTEITPLREENAALKKEIAIRRDLRAANKVLEQSNHDLKLKNRELNHKVEQLRNHDFKVHNEELKLKCNGAELALDRAVREHETAMAKLKTDHAVTTDEYSKELERLRNRIKELSSPPKSEQPGS